MLRIKHLRKGVDAYTYRSCIHCMLGLARSEVHGRSRLVKNEGSEMADMA